MKSIRLSFWFRGERNYIQGSDVYNEMMRVLQEAHPDKELDSIKLTIYHFSNRHCTMLVTGLGEETVAPTNSFATMRASCSVGKIASWLQETDEMVAESRPYDEESIVNLCVIDGSRARIRGDSGFTPIEVAIAMNKHLHHSLYGTSAGKWLFTGIDLARPLRQDDAGRLAITLRHNFANKLTKSSISSGEELLGSLNFYLAPRSK